MKGYLSLNLIPVELQRSFQARGGWAAAAGVLLIGQVLAFGIYEQLALRPELMAAKTQLAAYERMGRSLEQNRGGLPRLEATIQQVRELQTELAATRGGSFDWGLLAALLERAAGGTTKLAQVTLSPGDELQIVGSAPSLAEINAFIDHLPAQNFRDLYLQSVQTAANTGAGTLQFELNLRYVPPAVPGQ